jgi:hypothetical protein
MLDQKLQHGGRRKRTGDNSCCVGPIVEIPATVLTNLMLILVETCNKHLTAKMVSADKKMQNCGSQTGNTNHFFADDPHIGVVPTSKTMFSGTPSPMTTKKTVRRRLKLDH